MNDHKTHWLDQPENIRLVKRIGYLLLAFSVIAQVVVHMHSHFMIDSWFGFYAVYGFLTCVAMVLFAKLLGVWLKRPDDYYDD